MAGATARLRQVISAHERELLDEWMALQLRSVSTRRDLMNESELRAQSGEFLAALTRALNDNDDVRSAAWEPVRDLLSRVSRSRAVQGFSQTETATFVFSLKQPIFDRLASGAKDVDTLARDVWAMSAILDSLGLHTSEIYQRSRDDIIERQQREMLELSTPVVTLWQGVLALPLIGTLDSGRTQVIMESLLQRIVDTGSQIAILDITGVPTVDTLVAQHLLKTVAAARLMGADCIISGIRPQIAQTIVHLGVELNTVTTKATLADAFAIALRRIGFTVVKPGAAAAVSALDTPQRGI
jgi:rsbT co-antagonist protein RsbR